VGSRNVLLSASFTYPLILTAIGLADTIWSLGIVLFLFGFNGNLFNVSVNTQAVAVEQQYGRNIMASFHGVWSLAGLTGAGLGMLALKLNLTPLFHFMSVAAITILITLLQYQHTVRTPKPSSDSQKSIFVMPDKALLSLGLIAFCCMVCEGTMFDWSGVYFKKVVLAEESLVVMGYGAFTLATTSGRFVGDRLTNRIGLSNMLFGSGLLTTVGLLFAVWLPSLWTAALGFFLVGLGVSTVIPLVYSMAGKSKTMEPGMALAAVSTLGFMGFLIGPPLIGFLAEWGGLRISFAIVSIAGLVITFMAKRK
jgi:predicted MFS family arabinose efflux permease